MEDNKFTEQPEKRWQTTSSASRYDWSTSVMQKGCIHGGTLYDKSTKLYDSLKVNSLTTILGNKSPIDVPLAKCHPTIYEQS